MSVSLAMLVALAGGAGAAARYTLDYAVTRRLRTALPLGTWAVNIAGSFALGLLVGLLSGSGGEPAVLIVIGGGFLGAFTTFSTWMYESVRLAESGARRAAAVNLLGPLIAGLIAAAAGLWLGGLGAS
ncbi:MAG: fluoride efflux transporter CrcB [Phycisphaerales bacterium]|nr:fluoride efflux transporter CrcB [Phycisphaerales bacterium]